MLITGSLLVTRCPDYAESKVIENENPIQIRHALKSIRFYHIAAMLFNGMLFGTYVASVYKEVALKYIDDSTLTLAGAIGAFMNGSSRIVWATFMD